MNRIYCIKNRYQASSTMMCFITLSLFHGTVLVITADYRLQLTDKLIVSRLVDDINYLSNPLLLELESLECLLFFLFDLSYFPIALSLPLF